MLNKVTLIGNLGADPDSRAMPNGDTVTNITVATSMRWKDKNTGEKKEATEWHRVVFFRGLADVVAKYLRKGSQVHVEGRIRTRKWQADDGSDRYTTEIVATDMIMLGSKSGTTAGGSDVGTAAAGGNSGAPTASSDGFDDDIPF